MGSGFINTVQNMGKNINYTDGYTYATPTLREKYYANVEQMLKVFNGPNIVEIARRATQAENKETLEEYPILGHLINPIRQTIDPVTTALFANWPRFHHDYQIKGILREPDVEPDEFNINTLKISPFNIRENMGKTELAYIPPMNFIGCSTQTKLEIQLTYQALAIVGLPNVNLYLYQHNTLITLTPKEIMRRSRGLKNKTLSDTDLAELDNMYKEYKGKDTTNELGIASFDVSCDNRNESVRKDFYVRAFMDDPEANIEKLYKSYEPLQHAIGQRLQELWVKNKPLWDQYDFSQKTIRDAGNLVIGSKMTIDQYFFPFSSFQKKLTSLMGEIWNGIYGSGNKYIHEEIKAAKENAEKLKQAAELKKILEKENIDEKTLLTKLDDMSRTYAMVTQIIADEVLVYFITKSLLATVRCICDDEFQMQVYQLTSKTLLGLVIGTIVSLVAKYVLKLPSNVIFMIFLYNMFNLGNTIKMTIQKSYELSQAFVPLQDIFLEHFFQNKDLNILVKTHHQQYIINTNNILGTEKWAFIDTEKEAQSMNINISNTLG